MFYNEEKRKKMLIFSNIFLYLKIFILNIDWWESCKKNLIYGSFQMFFHLFWNKFIIFHVDGGGGGRGDRTTEYWGPEYFYQIVVQLGRISVSLLPTLVRRGLSCRHWALTRKIFQQICIKIFQDWGEKAFFCEHLREIITLCRPL